MSGTGSSREYRYDRLPGNLCCPDCGAAVHMSGKEAHERFHETLDLLIEKRTSADPASEAPSAGSTPSPCPSCGLPVWDAVHATGYRECLMTEVPR